MCEKSNENCCNFVNFLKQLRCHLSATDDVTSLSRRFDALNSNFERVNFVVELVKSAKINIELQKDVKSDEIATKFREQGNEMYKKKKLKEAWEFYTKSVCYAEENSVNLGLAYANRSAVLFELDLHKQCLMDIKRALDHNYPQHLKPKLFVREKNSKNTEIEALTPHEAIPIVTNNNPRIQSASDCIAVQEEENWGRFVVATRDIKIGEVLAVEKPFVVFVVNEFLNHCHECTSLCYNLIPCKTCTQAMYCSESCRDYAFDKYHKYECPILATLRFLQFDKLKLLALKIALLVRNRYNEIDNLGKTLDFYRSDCYKEIHNLVSNTTKRSVSDLFERATAAALIYDLVKTHTKFFTDFNETTFKEVLLLHMQTGPSNFHEIVELVPNSSGTYEPEEIASGAFAFLSLLNHSCCPNVARFSYGSTLVLRAIQNIQKGEQCFDNYGYHFALMDKNERKKRLQSQYYFDCVCKACENNWPLYDSLPSFGKHEIEDSIFSKLSSGDVETAETVVIDLCAKLGELQKLQPCKDFCQLQEIVKQCFVVMGNKRKIF
ncbi:SET and MYND domain-containing protein 4-like [Tribolium madens]|uniref:SET and MYND domain-containing protein 4-like n=1 Tax=Tribolium madens TaxID=41895 RepID=UPI001CF75814|nr:SET and MYND domain-containing protein 4-like [Tribolium madens]